MVEDVRSPLPEKDSRQLVVELVEDLRLLEGRVGGEAASPAQRRRIRKGVMVHFREISLSERAHLPGLVLPGDAREPQALPRQDAELSLSSVPLSGKDDRLPLGHVQDPPSVQPRDDVQSPPEERLLREEHRRRQEDDEEKPASARTILCMPLLPCEPGADVSSRGGAGRAS